MKICGLVITLNEEDKIERCIKSLKLVADHIIVIDSLSTDQTKKIASQLGVEVIDRAFEGDSDQRNYGALQSPYEWILSIDADEALDQQLTQSILSIKQRADVDSRSAFAMNRKNFIGTQHIKHSGWSPDWVVRLYAKSSYEFQGELHQKLNCPKSRTEQIDAGYLNHFSYRDFEHLFEKSNSYSTRAARILATSPQKISKISPIIHGLGALLQKLLFQKAYKDGQAGMAICFARAMGSYLKYAKALEIRSTQSDLKNA